MKPKPVTHCQPYLTQAQTRRLAKLLELHPRKEDTSLLEKLRRELIRAEEGDREHAEWHARHSAP